jgi:hypothetical protein
MKNLKLFENFEEKDLENLISGFEDLGISQKPKIYIGEILYSDDEGEHSCSLLAIPSSGEDVLPAVMKAVSVLTGYDGDFSGFLEHEQGLIDEIRSKFEGEKTFEWNEIFDSYKEAFHDHFAADCEWVVDWPRTKKFDSEAYVYSSLQGVSGAVATDELLKSNFGFGLAELNKMPKGNR